MNDYSAAVAKTRTLGDVPGKLGVPTPLPRDLELDARLACAPSSAEVRGVLFRLVEHVVPSVAQGAEIRGYAMYPLRDYLVRLHRAASASGPNVHAGLVRIHARAVTFLLGVPAARVFLGPKDRAPFALLERLERSRALLASYGDWRVSGRAGDVSIVVRDEPVWLDAVWCTMIRSIFPACGVPGGDVELDPDGPYAGRIRVRW